jgi:hypothetical protein
VLRVPWIEEEAGFMIWNRGDPATRTAHGPVLRSTVAGDPPSAQAPSMIGIMLLEYTEGVKVMPSGICELVTSA